MGVIRLVAALLSLPLLAACSTTVSEPLVSPDPGEPVPEVVGNAATDLAAPWGMALLPDGDLLVTHRDTATISVIDTGGQPRKVADVEGVVPGGEGGLLGIAISPEATQGLASVYVYYTAADDNRIAKLDWDGEQLAGQQVVFTGIPKAPIHNGGRIDFGPDGFLYVGTGDAGQAELAQDPQSLAGKILRITSDGEPAEGNPGPTSPVYSSGHRNVQGLAWDEDGRLWASEFGQNDVDELNQIQPGSNYGWPECEGRCDNDKYAQPAAQWSPTSIASPSGMAIADGSAWIASLRGERLWQVSLAGDSAGDPVDWFAGEYGRLRDVVVTESGSLLVATNNTDGRGSPQPKDDRLLRVELPG
ncbi:MAG: PQQ-dependent sugar dehydrogenase [Actinomycetia bacterium]|nr:PQQ-dependent sugar dehydrogenase [Actinomycetes bacterium]